MINVGLEAYAYVINAKDIQKVLETIHRIPGILYNWASLDYNEIAYWNKCYSLQKFMYDVYKKKGGKCDDPREFIGIYTPISKVDLFQLDSVCDDISFYEGICYETPELDMERFSSLIKRFIQKAGEEIPNGNFVYYYSC